MANWPRKTAAPARRRMRTPSARGALPPCALLSQKATDTYIHTYINTYILCCGTVERRARQ
eukprot:1144539-Heterocapsa_arctica.AAC.1